MCVSRREHRRNGEKTIAILPISPSLFTLSPYIYYLFSCFLPFVSLKFPCSSLPFSLSYRVVFFLYLIFPDFICLFICLFIFISSILLLFDFF